MSTIINKSIIAIALAGSVTPKTAAVGGAQSIIPSTPRAPSRAHGPLQVLSSGLPMPTTPIRRNVHAKLELELGEAIDLTPIQPRKLNFEAMAGPRPVLSAARLARLAPRHSGADFVIDEIKPKSEMVKVEVPVTPKSDVLATPRAPSRVRVARQLPSTSALVPTTPIRRGTALDLADAFDLTPIQPRKLTFEAIAGTRPALSAASLARLAPRHSWDEVVIDEIKPESRSTLVEVAMTPTSKVLKVPTTPRAPSRAHVGRWQMSPCSPTRLSALGRRVPRNSTDSVVFGDIKPLDFGTVLVQPVVSPSRLQRLVPRDSWGSVVIDEIVSRKA